MENTGNVGRKASTSSAASHRNERPKMGIGKEVRRETGGGNCIDKLVCVFVFGDALRSGSVPPLCNASQSSAATQIVQASAALTTGTINCNGNWVGYFWNSRSNIACNGGTTTVMEA